MASPAQEIDPAHGKRHDSACQLLIFQSRQSPNGRIGRVIQGFAREAEECAQEAALQQRDEAGDERARCGLAARTGLDHRRARTGARCRRTAHAPASAARSDATAASKSAGLCQIHRVAMWISAAGTGLAQGARNAKHRPRPAAGAPGRAARRRAGPRATRLRACRAREAAERRRSGGCAAPCAPTEGLREPLQRRQEGDDQQHDPRGEAEDLRRAEAGREPPEVRPQPP